MKVQKASETEFDWRLGNEIARCPFCGKRNVMKPDEAGWLSPTEECCKHFRSVNAGARPGHPWVLFEWEEHPVYRADARTSGETDFAPDTFKWAILDPNDLTPVGYAVAPDARTLRDDPPYIEGHDAWYWRWSGAPIKRVAISCAGGKGRWRWCPYDGNVSYEKAGE